VAGNETLRNGLPGACVALLEHPGAAAELRADPALMPGAVEEMLRWWTPVMTFRRTAGVPSGPEQNRCPVRIAIDRADMEGKNLDQRHLRKQNQLNTF